MYFLAFDILGEPFRTHQITKTHKNTFRTKSVRTPGTFFEKLKNI